MSIAPLAFLDSLAASVVDEFAKRTETDILVGKGIVCRLGEREYDIKPLPFTKAQAWRDRVAEVLDKARALAGTQFATSDNRLGLNPEAVLIALRFVASGVWPDIAALTVQWDGLAADADDILNTAYDHEIIRAFLVELCFAYPFMPAVLGNTTKIKAAVGLTVSSGDFAPTNRKARRAKR